jgi:hypothetical protein
MTLSKPAAMISPSAIACVALRLPDLDVAVRREFAQDGAHRALTHT